jgi:RNA polymerase sigma factor (sigma-70 family)
MQDLIQLINRYRAAVSMKDQERTLGAVLEFLNPEIYLFFLARVSDEDAQDLRSLTLTEIGKGLTKLNGETSGEAWGWCYTIARRKLAQHFEEKNKSIIVSMDPELLVSLSEASEESRPFESEREKMDVRNALDILKKSDPDCYFALWDRFIVGMDLEELAAKAKKSYDAMRMKVSRCLEKIGPHLN